jgi:hypothetical protein
MWDAGHAAHRDAEARPGGHQYGRQGVGRGESDPDRSVGRARVSWAVWERRDAARRAQQALRDGACRAWQPDRAEAAPPDERRAGQREDARQDLQAHPLQVRPEPPAQPGGELLRDADAVVPLQDAMAPPAWELPVALSQPAPLEMAGAGRKVFDRAWEP